MPTTQTIITSVGYGKESVWCVYSTEGKIWTELHRCSSHALFKEQLFCYRKNALQNHVLENRRATNIAGIKTQSSFLKATKTGKLVQVLVSLSYNIFDYQILLDLLPAQARYKGLCGTYSVLAHFELCTDYKSGSIWVCNFSGSLDNVSFCSPHSLCTHTLTACSYEAKALL